MKNPKLYIYLSRLLEELSLNRHKFYLFYYCWYSNCILYLEMSMLNLPYNTILSNQFSELEERRQVSTSFNFSKLWCFLFPENKLEKKIDKLLDSCIDVQQQLIMLKGLLTFSKENTEALANISMSELIERNNHLTNLYIHRKTEIERLLSKNSNYKREEVQQLDAIYQELISTSFDSLRLFKKLSKKTPIETTGLARRAVEISNDTLTKIHAR